MFSHNIFCLHTLSHEHGKFISDQCNAQQQQSPFDPSDYSLFKYGCCTTAEKYGHQLASYFIAKLGNEWLETITPEQPLYVTCSPFKRAPPAAFFLASSFLHCLNSYLLSRGQSPAIYVPLRRSTVFEGDYGALPLEERLSTMERNKISVGIPLEALHDKSLLIIDDIRITGTHETSILQALHGVPLRRALTLYYAVLLVGAAMPTLESHLNHTTVKTLDDLHALIKRTKVFNINARICKFLLSQPSLPSLQSFVDAVGPDVITTVYNYCVGDGYHTMSSYLAQFRIIEQAYMRIQEAQQQEWLQAQEVYLTGAPMVASSQLFPHMPQSEHECTKV